MADWGLFEVQVNTCAFCILQVVHVHFKTHLSHHCFVGSHGGFAWHLHGSAVGWCSAPTSSGLLRRWSRQRDMDGERLFAWDVTWSHGLGLGLKSWLRSLRILYGNRSLTISIGYPWFSHRLGSIPLGCSKERSTIRCFFGETSNSSISYLHLFAIPVFRWLCSRLVPQYQPTVMSGLIHATAVQVVCPDDVQRRELHGLRCPEKLWAQRAGNLAHLSWWLRNRCSANSRCEDHGEPNMANFGWLMAE